MAQQISGPIQTQQPITQRPVNQQLAGKQIPIEGKKSKWLIWLIVILVIIGVGVGVYFWRF